MQELASQATIAGPQYVNMITMYTSNLVCIAAVGHLGELQLAAASMSISMYSILGQGVILSMVGALDTQASQVMTNPDYLHCTLMILVAKLIWPTCYCRKHIWAG